MPRNNEYWRPQQQADPTMGLAPLPQQSSQPSGPGGFAGYPGNVWTSQGWGPGAEQWYNQTHGIDPSTGLITGPPGLIPAGIGLQWQQAHNQGVERARQTMMEQGLHWQEGSLGLLQSFRPGGGAYAAADAYSRMAGLHFQRAGMTQAVDYLADYRRDAEFQARRRARRAQRFAGIGSLVGMGVGGGLSALGVSPFLAGMAGNLAGSAVTGFQGAYGAGTAGVQMQQAFAGDKGQDPHQGFTVPGSQPREGAPGTPGGQPGSAGQNPQEGTATRAAGMEDTVGTAASYYQQAAQMQAALTLSLIQADLLEDPSWERLNAAIEHQAALRRPMGAQ